MPSRAPAIAEPAAIKLAAMGHRIRDQRKALRISATDVAESAGMSRATLRRIEQGEPSVTMGAYMGAATAVGLELELVDLRGARRAGRRARGKPPYPARIRLADYPQLKRLAWQLHGVTMLKPQEALGIYERNWRHIDAGAMEPDERTLVNALAQHLGGGRLLV